MPMLASHEAVSRPIIGIYLSVGGIHSAQTSTGSTGMLSHPLSEVFKSIFWVNKARFNEARVRLQATTMLQPGWDTYGADPPSQIARELAQKILRKLEAEALPPSRLLPSSEGGIAISFANEHGRAEIEIYNTGEIAAATYSDQDDPIVWDIDGSDSGIAAAIGQIRVRLSA